jgi:TM2 domain-containing membrane protein YozV
MSTEATVVGYCRACGKPLDAGSVRAAQGTIFCEEHVPAAVPAPSPEVVSPYTAAPVSTAPPLPGADVSPGLAFLLGFIPGVGAIYNGQYVKGLIHAIITGLIISIIDSGARGIEPVMSFLLASFWIYMPFEALHTAKRRRAGQSVDEFSSLLPMRPGTPRVPVAPLVLVALGILLLLNNLDLLDLRRVGRYWPVLLIALGIYMLYCRIAAASASSREGPRVKP